MRTTVKPKTIQLSFAAFLLSNETLKNKTKYRLVRYQDNVSEWRDMSSSLIAIGRYQENVSEWRDMSSSLIAVGRYQDNVSEWRDMFSSLIAVSVT